MKKTLLILLLSLFALAGCRDKKSYSVYTFAVPDASWIGSVRSDYNIMAGFLLDEGFIQTLTIENDNVEENDQMALRAFESKVESLRQFDLTRVMVGATSPGYMEFSYVLRAGSENKQIAHETFSVSY